MTQEQKDLLLKDLCARLPYGVILNCCNIVSETLTLISYKGLINNDYDIDEVKPYLFPLSSMTKEQWKEITDIQIKESLKSIDSNNDYMPNPLFSIGDLKTLDWCYANHIDYKGLISMGLAEDATGLNIY